MQLHCSRQAAGRHVQEEAPLSETSREHSKSKQVQVVQCQLLLCRALGAKPASAGRGVKLPSGSQCDRTVHRAVRDKMNAAFGVVSVVSSRLPEARCSKPLQARGCREEQPKAARVLHATQVGVATLSLPLVGLDTAAKKLALGHHMGHHSQCRTGLGSCCSRFTSAIEDPDLCGAQVAYVWT